MTSTRVCQVCEEPFEAARKDAKFCSDRCRQLAKRRTSRGVQESKQRGVRDQVLHELTRACRVDTFHGQLALQLAAEIEAPGATGVPALSKELRAVVTIALADSLGGADSGGASSAEAKKRAEDEVAKARAERDRKRRNAAGRA